MAIFKPSRALRPIPEKAAAIASMPYDVMDSDEALLVVCHLSLRSHSLDPDTWDLR